MASHWGSAHSPAFLHASFSPQPTSFLRFPVFLRLSVGPGGRPEAPSRPLPGAPTFLSRSAFCLWKSPEERDPSGLRPGGQQLGRLSSLQPSASSPPRGLSPAGLQGCLLTSAPSPLGACGVWSESLALWALTVPPLPLPPNQHAAGVPLLSLIGKGRTPPASASLCETSRALAVTTESLERKTESTWTRGSCPLGSPGSTVTRLDSRPVPAPVLPLGHHGPCLGRGGCLWRLGCREGTVTGGSASVLGWSGPAPAVAGRQGWSLRGGASGSPAPVQSTGEGCLLRVEEGTCPRVRGDTGRWAVSAVGSAASPFRLHRQLIRLETESVTKMKVWL